jgi:hypothetical protein
MKYAKEFNDFIEKMKEGLEVGEKKYGLSGLTDDNHLEMLEEEIRDIACYAYLLYQKIQMVKQNVLEYSDVKELVGGKSKNAFDVAQNRQDKIDGNT